MSHLGSHSRSRSPRSAKPGVYVLLGLAMKPLTNMSESPELSGADRWMEAARIAFPKPRNEQEAATEEQAFIARFQGNRSQRHVYIVSQLIYLSGARA